MENEKKKAKRKTQPKTETKAPKLPKKAWQIYVDNKREKFTQKNPQLKYGETTKQLKQIYHGLQPKTAEKYLAAAAADALRYQKELKKYKPPQTPQVQGQTKKRKRPSAIKGPRQAERIYWEENRLQFIARFPRLTVKEINQKIVQTWKELEPEKQAPYKQKSKEETLHHQQVQLLKQNSTSEERPSKKRKQ